MKKNFFKFLRLLSGFFLIVLGFLGLFLPVLQGVLFLALGLLLLSVDIPVVHRWVEKLEGGHPHLGPKIKKWREIFLKKFQAP